MENKTITTFLKYTHLCISFLTISSVIPLQANDIEIQLSCNLLTNLSCSFSLPQNSTISDVVTEGIKQINETAKENFSKIRVTSLLSLDITNQKTFETEFYKVKNSFGIRLDQCEEANLEEWKEKNEELSKVLLTSFIEDDPQVLAIQFTPDFTSVSYTVVIKNPESQEESCRIENVDVLDENFVTTHLKDNINFIGCRSIKDIAGDDKSAVFIDKDDNCVITIFTEKPESHPSLDNNNKKKKKKNKDTRNNSHDDNTTSETTMTSDYFFLLVIAGVVSYPLYKVIKKVLNKKPSPTFHFNDNEVHQQSQNDISSIITDLSHLIQQSGKEKTEKSSDNVVHTDSQEEEHNHNGSGSNLYSRKRPKKPKNNRPTKK